MARVREAIVLAAGVSLRFRRKTSYHKIRAEIEGKPLFTYPVTSLYLAGIRSFIIVVNRSTYYIVKEIIDKWLSHLEADFRLVVNNNPERGNGYSFLVGAREATEDRFLISMSDHIYPPRIAQIVASKKPPALGGDSEPLYIDISEATLIHTRWGKVVKVGKRLDVFEYVDIGVHLFEKDLPYSECKMEKLELSSLINCLASRVKIRVADVKGTPWTEVDTYEDYLEVTQGSRKFIIKEVLWEWRKVAPEPLW